MKKLTNAETKHLKAHANLLRVKGEIDDLNYNVSA